MLSFFSLTFILYFTNKAIFMITSSQSVCLYVHFKVSDPRREQLNQWMNYHYTWCETSCH